MEFQMDLPGWLNRYSCPAFLVRENHILCRNQAAQALLLEPGMDIRELLMTGRTEYSAFQDGCLYLHLRLSSNGCGASVTKAGDSDLFLLDQDPEDRDLRCLSLAARELRNPLSNLMIAADILKGKSNADPGVQEQLARLSRSLHQLHRLVNNMSDAGRSELLTPSGIHDWNRLFHDIFEKLHTQLKETQVHLTYDGLHHSVYGVANPGQIERAVLNMVSNAMKFTPASGTIRSTLRQKEGLLYLSIQDSGSGIADNVLGTVFARYQRQPGIEDSRYGIGLGMVLIRSAATDHGGTVLIDQPEGMGTRVTMTLAIRQDGPVLKTPVLSPLVEDSQLVLRELSDCLGWEYYKE